MKATLSISLIAACLLTACTSGPAFFPTTLDKVPNQRAELIIYRPVIAFHVVRPCLDYALDGKPFALRDAEFYKATVSPGVHTITAKNTTATFKLAPGSRTYVRMDFNLNTESTGPGASVAGGMAGGAVGGLIGGLIDEVRANQGPERPKYVIEQMSEEAALIDLRQINETIKCNL